MPVLRSENLPSSATPFSMANVEEVARRVLLKARLQAEQLLAAAQEEAEKLREAARQEGAKDGFEHGHAEGVRHGEQAGRQQAFDTHAAELSALAGTLAAVTTEFDAARRAIEADALHDVVALSTAIARKVTKRQALIEPEVLSANLSDAMRLAVGASDLRIAVHPDQRRLLESLLPSLKLQWPDLKHVELIEDDRLSPGGSRIETRAGSIDADLDAQLDRVIADLLPAASKDA